MGNGMCSRKQKRIFQTLLLLTVVFGFLYGAMLYYELQGQLRKAEATALKYQQHQESLSAQLQVVYEHRSRLEKSLQKERLEHKKAKEDFLVYKLEAQETLNKGRVSHHFNTRYADTELFQCPIWYLQSQHEELKKQHADLEEDHRKQGEEFSRTFSDHKERYLQLQQEKEQEISKLKESLYNLREENRQLRKAHQDIHTQLQDVKSQVEEYKQLKDTLNKMPSFRQPDKLEQPNDILCTHNLVYVLQNEKPKEREEINTQEKDDRAELFHLRRRANEGQHAKELNIQEQQEAGEDDEQRVDQVEEERKKELEEEEMEQAGQPEHLEEEQDQVPEEHEWKKQEQKEEETNMLGDHLHSEITSTKAVTNRHKPAYQQQLEQQHLAAQRAEEANQLREHQESLHQQRLRGQLLRQQQLQEKELQLQKQAEQGEKLYKNRLSQQAHYDTMDHDIVQGEEQQGIQEEEGGKIKYMSLPCSQVPCVLPFMGDFNIHFISSLDSTMEDVNPADDPNNQGEDEFEEAEQEREENLPDENEKHKQTSQKQGHPGMEEHLVMAGNPDQQEDNVDEQYQEEGEEEIQEDLTEEKKRELERNAEEPYGENDENNNQKEVHEENYEEEEEEEEEGRAVAAKTRRRGEM
uniref:Golgi integral membrane protein 4 n=1 Tax=Bubo bubo TaxID=30461 RepID=A0A8C0F6Q5_BUBBB